MGPPLRVRAGNPAFAALRWRSSALPTAANLRSLVPHDAPVYNLVDALQNAEDRCLPPAPGDEFLIFSATMLGVAVPFYNDEQITDACFKVLLSYRVVDAFLSTLPLPSSCEASPVDVPQTSAISPSLTPLPVTQHKRLPLACLNDIPSLISSARAGISSYLADSSLHASTTAACSTFLSQHPVLCMYTCHTGKIAKRGTLNMIINLLSAALHLSYLLSGKICMAKDMAEFEQWLLSIAAISPDTELALFNPTQLGRGSRLKPHHMQNVLACALSVSPAILLCGRNLQDAPGKDALLALQATP
ncbi:hypothetical protein DXG01_005332 [Tephrocybe rancida]|nr:hypothetical protein DXG01_005332 [Tephrocybe rancida]